MPFLYIEWKNYILYDIIVSKITVLYLKLSYRIIKLHMIIIKGIRKWQLTYLPEKKN